MPEILRMPEIAANTPEALLSQWLVEPHAAFRAGTPLATVETEKAAVDVEAEAEGVLLRVLVDPGRTVEVGTPIAIWGAADEPDEAVEALLASLGVTTSDTPTADAPAADAPAADGAPPAADAAAVGAVNGHGAQRIFSSPLARRIARERGVDLSTLSGSGPGGRIRRRDVEAALTGRATGPAVPSAQPEPSPAPQEPAAPVPPQPVASPAVAGAGSEYREIPVSRMRQAIARRLTESVQSAPHFYLRGSARVDRLLALRAELNEGAPVKISVTDLLVKAVAVAHTAVPALNVTWAGDTIRQYTQVDVAVAVATETGLVTPVVRGVDGLTPSRIAATTRDLAERARSRTLQPTELEGGTITLTNLGMYGTEEFAAIINPPQAAILAVGAARPEPVVENGSLAVGTVLRLTLSVDHRPVDGATAAQWLRVFVDLLEHPLRILA